jgi:hypothetical protein
MLILISTTLHGKIQSDFQVLTCGSSTLSHPDPDQAENTSQAALEIGNHKVKYLLSIIEAWEVKGVTSFW